MLIFLLTGILLTPANYWANEITTIAYIENIIIPYVQKERALLGLSDDHWCSSFV